MEPHSTEGELAILRVLWARRGPSTVRDVHDALNWTKDTAYTTVRKMMTIMAEKGLVRRDESVQIQIQGHELYFPSIYRK